MRFGQDEFAFLKPEDNGGLLGMEMPGEIANADMTVVYDPVYENKNNTEGWMNLNLHCNFPNTVSNLGRMEVRSFSVERVANIRN